MPMGVRFARRMHVLMLLVRVVEMVVVR